MWDNIFSPLTVSRAPAIGIAGVAKPDGESSLLARRLLTHLGVSTSLYESAARVIGLPNGPLRLMDKGRFYLRRKYLNPRNGLSPWEPFLSEWCYQAVKPWPACRQRRHAPYSLSPEAGSLNIASAPRGILLLSSVKGIHPEALYVLADAEPRRVYNNS